MTRADPTQAEPPVDTVGWIGAGRMGAAMVRLLARGGVDVTVYNRTRAKAEALIADGARVADRIVDLADRDVVFTMVSDSADLAQVLTGPGGLLTADGAAPAVIVDCSTVSTATSAAMRAAAVRERGERRRREPRAERPVVVRRGGRVSHRGPAADVGRRARGRERGGPRRRTARAMRACCA